jgi:hypothetical protein
MPVMFTGEANGWLSFGVLCLLCGFVAHRVEPGPHVFADEQLPQPILKEAVASLELPFG